MHKREWLFRRNCSLAPRQFALAFGGLGIGLFMFSLPFALFYGAWLVVAFAIMEATALAVAFVNYARHACDHEHIVLADGALLIECIEAEQVKQIRLQPGWIQVVTPRRYGDLISLQYGHYDVQVGRFITAEKRQIFAEELRRELRKNN